MGGLSHTVSGDIASFRTPSRVPIESLKFHFLPKQAAGTPTPANPIPIEGWTGLNGHQSQENLFEYKELTVSAVGDDAKYEWVGNKLKISVKRGNLPYNVSHQISMRWDVPDIFRGKSVMFFTKGLANSNENHHAVIIVELRRSDGTLISDLTVCNVINNSFSRKVTLTSETAYCIIIYRMNQGTTVTFTTDDYFTVDGFFANYPNVVTSDPIYKEKIIPITFPTGKNLLNTMDVNNLLWSNTVSPGRIDTVDVGTGNANYTKFNQVFHAGTYTISGKISGPGVKAIRLLCSSQITGSIWNSYYNAYFIDTFVGGKWTFILNEDSTIGVVFVIADGGGNKPGSIYNLQLEYGSEATDFEPWSPISEFYGGYIDPVAGEIVAEYKKHIYDGTTMRVSMNYKTSGRFYGIKAVSDCQSGSGGRVISNMLKTQTNHGENICTQRPSDPGYLMDFALSSFCDLSIEAYDALTIQEQADLVNDYLAELYENDTPLIIIYKLIEPIHIPIPAEDLKAFLDHNNFWSDTNDITEVTYAVTESKDILATRKKAMDFDHAHTYRGAGVYRTES